MAKILLVEDDNNLREIYEARLQAEGYDIVSAMDGEEALVVAKKEKPELIISDVMMPRISGFEMLDILRNTDELKHVRIIMLTALGQAEDRTRADQLGADRYLVKSQVTLEDIVKAAQELLGEVPAAAPQSPSIAAAAAEVAQPTPAPAPVAVPVTAAPAVAPTPVPNVPVVQPPLPVTAAPATPAPTSAPAPGLTPAPVASVPEPNAPAPSVPVPAPAISVVPPPAATPAPSEPVVPPVLAPAPEPEKPVFPPPAAVEPDKPSVETTTAPEVTPVPEPPTAPPAEPIEPPATTAVASPEVVTAKVDDAQPQSTSDEEATMKAQIESFVSQSDAPETSSPATPPMPPSTEPAPEAPELPATPGTPVVEPPVVPTSTAPADDAPASTDNLVADAMKDLAADTAASNAAPTVFSPSAQPTPAPAPAKPPESTPAAPKPKADDDDGVAIAHKKVISPITTPTEETKPGLDELLAKEGMNSIDDVATPGAYGAGTPPAAESQIEERHQPPHPPGHVIAPTPAQAASGAVDPNSIAL